MEFINSLIDGLNLFNLTITSEQAEECLKYASMIEEANNYINLTRIVGAEQMAIKHFVDSAVPIGYKLIPKEGRLLDIGTGAGFPGMVLKIMKPQLEVTLMDAVAKKVNFLQQVIDGMSISKVKSLHSRAEELGHDKKHRESYNVVTNRAVASLPTLMELTLPFVKPGGKVICWKGPNVNEELEISQVVLKKLGGQVSRIIRYSLPNDWGERVLIVIDKYGMCPKEYPRRPDIIRKKPIVG
jgi:16S rRNA (guanine527-N7)-methyltransferase